MNQHQGKNYAQSVRSRLLQKSKQQGEAFNLLLTRYAVERLLYRLAKSPYSNQFILKGATLFTVWHSSPHRATKDLDLLGYSTNKVSELEEIFKIICQDSYAEDGVEFYPETVKGERIKEKQEYEGVRLKIEGKLGSARLTVQVDIGFGDAITPAPELGEFPSILNLPSAQLRVYPRETVVAEKFQAMVSLGIANSRLKDFYDLWFLAHQAQFQGDILCQAMRATFNRRKTPLPTEEPLALTGKFTEDFLKQSQWSGFINKNQLESNCENLSNTVAVLNSFLMPPCLAASKNTPFNYIWTPQQQWHL